MKILIVDDEKEIVNLLVKFLMKKGYRRVTGESSPERAIMLLKKGDFDLVISDLVMEPYDGFDILKEAKKKKTDFIMMTAHATVESAVKAIKEGATDYIVKPFALDELLLKIKRIEKERKVIQENEILKKTELIAYSPGMKKVLELVHNVAQTDFPVLLLGETGVGKTLIAEMIHRESKRSTGPFVSLNVSGIPETLLESELFGYVRGAFTGADRNKTGLFEMANNGTLFLDEIGDIPLSAQVKLLKVIEEGSYYRLGASKPTEVNVRIVAATNTDLKKAIKEGKFREDLYFRISVFPIRIPPLRERKEDIPPLVNYYFKRFGHKEGISSDALSELMSYTWPGNVRELVNVLQRAIVLSGGKKVEKEHIVLDAEENERLVPIEEAEREMIKKALERTGGNKKEAAKLLGISRKMLYTRLKKYGLL